MRYTEKLAARIAAAHTHLCVGLDPRPDLIKEPLKEFLLRVIAESAPHAACFKPNIAYFEAMGSIRRAISVMKKRGGSHESTIREFHIGNTGIVVGQPLTDFQGVLRGVPTYYGHSDPLMERSLRD